jgi:hypothetical protein
MMMAEQDRPEGSKRVSLVFRLCAAQLAVASAIVMAASGECKPSSGATAFTYTRFPAFVLLAWGSIAAAVLQAVAVYLQQSLGLGLGAEDDDDYYKTVTEKREEGIGAAGIVFVLVDYVTLPLLCSVMTAAYVTRGAYGHQIGVCARFAGQVELANILSLAACVATLIAAAFRPRLV